jgi:hypothetical protein
MTLLEHHCFSVCKAQQCPVSTVIAAITSFENGERRQRYANGRTLSSLVDCSDRALLRVINEMSNSPTTFHTPNGGCHPLWVLSHLTFDEGMIPQVLFGDGNPVSEWQRMFGPDSEPAAPAASVIGSHFPKDLSHDAKPNLCIFGG